MTTRRLIDSLAFAVVVLLLLVLAVSLAHSQTVSGLPTVTDGDTLRLGGERVRLEGIDAPESVQTCRTATGSRYDCGQAATKALRGRIGGRPVRCEAEGRGRYGRLIAVCYAANGADLNKWMVDRGHAMAYRRYSLRYVEQEAAARKARRGIWQGRFVKPWRWRQGERLP